MKKIIISTLICLWGISLQAASYIYVENGITLPLKKQGVILYAGDPVEVIADKGNNVLVKISGYINPKKKHYLYATKNYELVLAKVENPKSLKLKHTRAILKVAVPKTVITNDLDDAWAYGSDLFYDKCTKCHHAKIVEHHTMLTWDALFDSMKLKAKTTEEQNKKILRFLRAFAKDGILKESE